MPTDDGAPQALGPAPRLIPRPLREDEVLAHRVLWCPHYDGCLDSVIRQLPPSRSGHQPQSWSCAGCPVGGLPPAELVTPQLDLDASATMRSTRIVETLAEDQRPWTALELAEALEEDVTDVSVSAEKLVMRGRIARTAPRTFALPEVAATLPPRPPDPPGVWSRVIELLERSPRIWTARELAEDLDTTPQRAANALRDLAYAGRIERVANGRYQRLGGARCSA